MRIVSPHSPIRRSPRTPGGWVVLGALGLLLTGCGSHLVKVNSSVVRLRIDEYRITPQLVQIRPGRMKIIAVNTGILTHNIRVESSYPNSNGNPIVLGGTPILFPGHKGNSCANPTPTETCPKLDLPPGTYKLVDTIANHADYGDYGTLIVK